MTALTGKAQEALGRIHNRIEKLKSLAQVSRMIDYVLEAFYEDYGEMQFENWRERLEDLEQLAIFAAGYDKLEDFLADATLSEGFRGDRAAATAVDADKEYLVLSTIHQAKGLEWKNVFVVGLVDGQFPHHKSRARREELEEERRLFYVAITRARERLYLTYPLTSTASLGTVVHQPSLFVRELDPQLYQETQNEETVIEYAS